MEAEAFKDWLANPLSVLSIGAMVGMISLILVRALGGSLAAYAAKKGEHVAIKEDGPQIFTHAEGVAHATRKGENLATKQDLDDFLENLHKSEVTRTAVAHKDWTAREWRAARMRNLEPFMSHALEALSAHVDCMKSYRSGQGDGSYDPRATLKVRTLQHLFYPEIELATDGFLGPCVNGRIAAQQFYWSQMQADEEFRDFDSEESWAEHEKQLESMQMGLHQLTAEVKHMALGIYGRQRPEYIFPDAPPAE